MATRVFNHPAIIILLNAEVVDFLAAKAPPPNPKRPDGLSSRHRDTQLAAIRLRIIPDYGADASPSADRSKVDVGSQEVREFLGAGQEAGQEAREARQEAREAGQEAREVVLEVAGAFVAIGHVLNTAFFQGDLRKDAEGYVFTLPGSTVTSIPGVYAAGDGPRLGGNGNGG
jgi:hypothetical protein